MRFLIDECLHTSLADVANKAGHEAHHVNRRGWLGLKDHQLREVARQGEFVFVTNNARDFRRLMEQTELHAGLIVIIPNVTPTRQRELFEHALLETTGLPDMINKAWKSTFTRSAFTSCRSSDSRTVGERLLEIASQMPQGVAAPITPDRKL